MCRQSRKAWHACPPCPCLPTHIMPPLSHLRTHMCAPAHTPMPIPQSSTHQTHTSGVTNTASPPTPTHACTQRAAHPGCHQERRAKAARVAQRAVWPLSRVSGIAFRSYRLHRLSLVDGGGSQPNRRGAPFVIWIGGVCESVTRPLFPGCCPWKRALRADDIQCDCEPLVGSHKTSIH